MKPLTSPDDADLRINRDDLDGELVHQPDLVEQVGRAYVAAMTARDMFDLDKKAALAELANKIRTRMRKNDPKVTVSAIDNAISCSKEAVDLERQSIRLAESVRLWDVLNDRVRSRGYVLHKLADMQVIFGGAVAGQSEHGSREARKRREFAEDARGGITRKRLKGRED